MGATMQLWENKDASIEEGCCSPSSTYDAKRVCDKLRNTSLYFKL